LNSAFDPAVLLIGHPNFEPYAQTARDVCRMIRRDQVREFPADSISRENLAGLAEPEFVVVSQACSDQYSEREVNQLVARFPRSRLICSYGPWCCSDGRNRQIWPLSVRVPAQSFTRRFQLEYAFAKSRKERLPLTLSRSELFELDFGFASRKPANSKSVAVDSPDAVWTKMICTSLQAHGLDARVSGERVEADAIIFDADPWDDQREWRLTELRQGHSFANLILCTGSPLMEAESAMVFASPLPQWFKLGPLCDLIDLITAK
jgi:hypothetical protein